jgi:hypothetical protein
MQGNLMTNLRTQCVTGPSQALRSGEKANLASPVISNEDLGAADSFVWESKFLAATFVRVSCQPLHSLAVSTALRIARQ